MSTNVLSAFAPIRAFVFDVDGVMTDGTVIADPSGELLRTLSIRDGYAIKRALLTGYRVAIITGGRSEAVRKRFLNLGPVDYYSNVQDKGPVMQGYIDRHGLAPAEVLFMGDDLPDLAPMRIAGLACAPADACPEVLAEAQYVSPRTGGNHCVRDVIERTLKLNGHWAAAA